MQIKKTKFVEYKPIGNAFLITRLLSAPLSNSKFCGEGRREGASRNNFGETRRLRLTNTLSCHFVNFTTK